MWIWSWQFIFTAICCSMISEEIELLILVVLELPVKNVGRGLCRRLPSEDIVHVLRLPCSVCWCASLGEVVGRLHELQSLQVDKTKDKEKQRSEARSIVHRRRKALTDLFKALELIGASTQQLCHNITLFPSPIKKYPSGTTVWMHTHLRLHIHVHMVHHFNSHFLQTTHVVGLLHVIQTLVLSVTGGAVYGVGSLTWQQTSMWTCHCLYFSGCLPILLPNNDVIALKSDRNQHILSVHVYVYDDVLFSIVC